MRGIFQIVDPSTNAVLLDLNLLGNYWDSPNPTGFGLLGDIDFGTVPATTEWLESSLGGDQAVRTRRPNVDMGFKLWAMAPSADALQVLVSDLNRYLRTDGVIKWQPYGVNDPVYIDYFASPLTPLLHGGDRGVNWVYEQLATNGIPVRVTRHPWVRRTPLAPITAIVGNGVGDRTMIVHNPDNAPALAKVEITPRQVSAKVVEARIGRRTRGDLTEFESVCAFEIESATLYNQTTVVGSQSSASGNSVARTDFSTFSGLARRWRHVITPTTDTTTQGRFKVFCVLKVSNAGVYKVQLRWNPGNANPADSLGTFEPIELEFSDIGIYHFVEIDMGILELRQGGQVTLEGWAAREPIDDDDKDANDEAVSTGTLDWDLAYLMPLDEIDTVASVPGHRRGGSNVTAYLGRELRERGAVDIQYLPERKQDSVILNSVGDWAATTPMELDAGRHKVRVRVSIRNRNKKKQKIGVLKVVGTSNADPRSPVSDGDGAITIDLRSRKKLWTRRRKTIVFDVGPDGLSTSTSYRFMVELTNEPGSSDAQIVVERLSHRFHRYSTSTSKMELDGNPNRQARLYQGDDPVAPLSLSGGFIQLAPDDNCLIFSFGDIPAHGYDDVDDRESLTRIKPDRTADVSVTITPRRTL